MEHRILGNTDLTALVVGLSYYGMSDAYGPAHDAESIATIRPALGAAEGCDVMTTCYLGGPIEGQ